MNGKKGLIDSNVIIDISNEKLKLSAIIAEYDYLYASIISYVETLGYNFLNSRSKCNLTGKKRSKIKSEKREKAFSFFSLKG